MKFALLCFIVALVAAVSAQQIQSVTSYNPGLLRHMTVAGLPDLQNPNALGVLGVGVDITTGGDTISGEVDAIGFGMRNPAAGHQDMVFYLGYFTGSGQYNPAAQIGSVQASLAELIAAFHSLVGYHERNGQPGFQYKLGDPLFCLFGLPAGKTDCLEVKAIYELNKAAWTTISITNSSCPAGYNDKCRVYSFSTRTTDNVFKITIHLASEPVLINGVRVEPSYGKIDIEINPPWNSVELPATTPLRLALFSSYAGKAGSFGAARAAVVDGDEAVVFTAQDKSAYFSWDGVAKIGSNDRTVHVQGISGKSILNYQCNNCAEKGVIDFYKWAIGIWESWGWSVQLLLFSWDQDRPANVVWDPKLGVETSSSNIVYQDSAAPHVTVAAAAVLAAAAAFYRNY